jgi:hypothetical protein
VTAHRRVVVGSSVDDSNVEEVALAPRGNRLAVLWGRDDVASLPVPVEHELPAGFLPPPGGWRFSLLTFLPDDSLPLGEGEGTVLPDLSAQMAKGGGRGMHTTPSVDVVLVVTGELALEVDDGSEVRLAAGDTVVVHGARHGWRNRSAEPATVALFMVGAHHPEA